MNIDKTSRKKLSYPSFTVTFPPDVFHISKVPISPGSAADATCQDWKLHDSKRGWLQVPRPTPATSRIGGTNWSW